MNMSINQYERWRKRFPTMYIPEPNSGCWLWTGAIGSDGYGQISAWNDVLHKTSSEKAHRLSYFINRGPIPTGLRVLHSCDTPLCVNPGHLFLGSDKDNKHDAVSKNRHAHHETHARAKVNRELVRQIREHWRNKTKSQSQIARELGMNPSTISDIATGRSWRGI